jgi:hypothetical protein
VRLPPPDEEDVNALLIRTARRVLRLLARSGDERAPPDDALASLAAAGLSAQGGTGDHPPARRLTAFLEGFSLHAGTVVHEDDREGRERLCFYGARGALALSRLTELDDGRFRYRLKRPLRSGATELVLTGVELLQKLAPLIPPPRQNLTRFHGVFAPSSKLRAAVVRLTETARSPPAAPPPVAPFSPPRAQTTTVPARYRVDWASLLRRVFDVDVFACERCGGRMRLLAFIPDERVARKILRHVGLPDAPVPLERARGPPQADLDL